MTADVGIPRQVVERPGNPSYRARKPPEAIRVHLCGFDDGILVLRCHDEHVAEEVVLRAWRAGQLDPREIVPAWFDRVDVPARSIWVRWVVDDPAQWPNGPGSWERELRGTLGATPAVLFATADTTDRIPT